jgi:menaquinone-specific isochorismate synthase
MWVTTVGADPGSTDTDLATLDVGSGSDSRRSGSASQRDRPRHAGSTLRDDAWLDAVAQVLENIEAGRYAKVVLARDLHLWSRAPFDVTGVLHALADRFPSCATFFIDHLVGASPERLVRLVGRDVSSRVLAGTVGRGGDVEEDAQLGAALLASRKDRHEHDLALRSATEALARCCEELDVPEEPSLMVLDNVQHLGTDLTGVLAESGGQVDVLDLVERLHPTAAVCGTPREAALQAIRELEGMPRGRYAGPVGWFTPDGDGEFAIALRCAEVHGERARLFAGAGVVAGSLPEAELTETWLKLQAMTGVLDR